MQDSGCLPVTSPSLRLHRILGKDLSNPSDLPVNQADLDSMRVKCRVCQDFLYRTPRPLPGTLVALLDDLNTNSRAQG